ncbi:MAG: hypothetical protein C0417_02205 [Chlorobiaceae bacterium]|nr:hypothetical protein [Chlorobiaceae bacterium]
MLILPVFYTLVQLKVEIINHFKEYLVGELRKYVIGIDGGGTKTNALLVNFDGTVVAEASAGSTQLQTVGVKESSQILFDLIFHCCQQVGSTADSIHNVIMGIAGAGRVSDRTDLVSSLQSIAAKKKFPLNNITVETDARIALEAAFAGGPGIIVIAGTGSIALYRTEDGKILRTGGWGKLLGDEGSGYAVGRDGLNAVMRQYDNRGDKTELTRKALTHFQVNSTDELIQMIYYGKADVSSFAPRVCEAASAFDHVAHSVLVKNATELMDHVRVLIMQSRPKKKIPVALMGGMLESDTPYSKMVREKIISSLPNVVVQKPKFPAAFGAAIMGLNAFK